MGVLRDLELDVLARVFPPLFFRLGGIEWARYCPCMWEGIICKRWSWAGRTVHGHLHGTLYIGVDRMLSTRLMHDYLGQDLFQVSCAQAFGSYGHIYYSIAD